MKKNLSDQFWSHKSVQDAESDFDNEYIYVHTDRSQLI